MARAIPLMLMHAEAGIRQDGIVLSILISLAPYTAVGGCLISLSGGNQTEKVKAR